MQAMEFGKKWRDRPLVEMIAADPGYCRWAVASARFRTEHQAAYRVVRAAVVGALLAEQAAEDVADLV
jgi:hypothetical protein